MLLALYRILFANRPYYIRFAPTRILRAVFALVQSNPVCPSVVSERKIYITRRTHAPLVRNAPAYIDYTSRIVGDGPAPDTVRNAVRPEVTETSRAHHKPNGVYGGSESLTWYGGRVDRRDRSATRTTASAETVV